MNVRIINEIRPLLPGFALTLCGLMVISFFLPHDNSEAAWPVGMLISAFGCILMGIATFGDEISNRTMTLLLTQPFSRQTIWREKMTALALAIGVLLGVALICTCLITRILVPEVVVVMATEVVVFLGVFCTTPFWTLSIKNIPGAVTGATAMPFVLILIASAIFDHLPAFKPYQDNSAVEAIFFLPVLLAYFAACYWGGRQLFLKMEALDAQGPDIALPAKLEQSLVRPFKGFIPQFTGQWSSLINKELHLQRLGFIMAAIFCVLVPLAYFAWKLSARSGVPEIGEETVLSVLAMTVLASTFAIYVILIPLITGAGCIAEEKNWKTHEWHLTLPPSKLKQWFAKVLVAFAITLVLGILLPVIFIAAIAHPNLDLVLYGALSSVFAVCLGIFASSITSNSMRAIILTLILLGLGSACAAFGYDAGDAAQGYLISHVSVDNPNTIVIELNRYLRAVAITAAGLSCALIGLILYLGFLNYRTGEAGVKRAWIHSGLILAAVWFAAFLMTVSFGFFLRASYLTA